METLLAKSKSSTSQQQNESPIAAIQQKSANKQTKISDRLLSVKHSPKISASQQLTRTPVSSQKVLPPNRPSSLVKTTISSKLTAASPTKTPSNKRVKHDKSIDNDSIVSTMDDSIQSEASNESNPMKKSAAKRPKRDRTLSLSSNEDDLETDSLSRRPVRRALVVSSPDQENSQTIAPKQSLSKISITKKQLSAAEVSNSF